MSMIPKQWDASIDFVLSQKGVKAIFMRAYENVRRIVFYSSLIFFSGVMSEIVSSRCFSLAFQVKNIRIQTYMSSYVSWAIVLFVPFLLQSVTRSRKPYSFFLSRWLVWYFIVLVIAFLFEAPFSFFIQIIPDAVYCAIDVVQRAVFRLLLFILPFILMKHLSAGGALIPAKMLRAARLGLHALWLELPCVTLFGCMLLPLFYVRYSGFLYDHFMAFSPYTATLFYLYMGIFLMQVAWSIQLAIYQIRVLKK